MLVGIDIVDRDSKNVLDNDIKRILKTLKVEEICVKQLTDEHLNIYYKTNNCVMYNNMIRVLAKCEFSSIIVVDKFNNKDFNWEKLS